MKNGTMCYLRRKRAKETLFIHRTKGKKDIHDGFFVPPGGTTERGERGIDCIIREFEEETGLKLSNPKLKIIATFHNQGRILGGKKNPEDWCVEIYSASNYSGILKSEHPKAEPIWIPDSKIRDIKMYDADRKIFDLMFKPGVRELITEYSGEELIRFHHERVY